ncbi:hypothetical protein Tco_0633260, partial [Tanacetum coccineum]
MTGLQSSSIKILCVQYDGLIPLMSYIFQAIAPLRLSNTCRSEIFSFLDNSDEIIMGKDLSPLSSLRNWIRRIIRRIKIFGSDSLFPLLLEDSQHS